MLQYTDVSQRMSGRALNTFISRFLCFPSSIEQHVEACRITAWDPVMLPPAPPCLYWSTNAALLHSSSPSNFIRPVPLAIIATALINLTHSSLPEANEAHLLSFSFSHIKHLIGLTSDEASHSLSVTSKGITVPDLQAAIKKPSRKWIPFKTQVRYFAEREAWLNKRWVLAETCSVKGQARNRSEFKTG